MKVKKRFKISILLLLILLSFLSYSIFAEVIDFIICTINDVPITYIQFMRELKRVELFYKNKVGKIPANIKEIVFQNLEEKILLMLEAKKLNITIKDEEIKYNIEMLKKQYNLNDQQFLQQINFEGYTYKEFIENYRFQLLKYRFLQMYIKKRIKEPTLSELKKFYDEKKNSFKGSYRYEIIKYFLELPENAKFKEKLNAKRAIKEFKKLIINKNYNTAYNFIKNKYNVEILMKSENFYPELSEKDFSLKIKFLDSGDFSDIFFYKGSYYIVYVKKKEKINYIPFEDVRDKIYNYLEQERIQQEYEKWLNESKKNAVIIWYRKDIIFGN